MLMIMANGSESKVSSFEEERGRDDEKPHGRDDRSLVFGVKIYAVAGGGSEVDHFRTT